jgi:hypothetical protein
MIDVELLKLESLIGMINDFRPGDLRLSASGILPEQSGPGQSFNWDILGIQRDVDTFEGRMSPAGIRKLTVLKNQSAVLARTFKSTFVPGAVLIDLRNFGSESRQRIAEDTVGRELQSLSRLIDRQNEFMYSQALQGSLAMTIDGVPHTVNYGFSGSHVLTVGGGIPASWALPASDIVADIRNMKVRIAEDSGFQAATVWTSTEVIEYLIKNDFVNSYFASTPAGVQALTEGTIGRFMGLNWIAYDGTYKDAAGAVQRFIPKNKLIVTPGPDAEWGFFRKGSDAVPTDDGRDMQEVIGRYAYSDLSKNPASIGLYAGEVRLPIIRIPDALVVATVTP